MDINIVHFNNKQSIKYIILEMHGRLVIYTKSILFLIYK
jgi:hypothetical protein